jgi:hypothetical protein
MTTDNYILLVLALPYGYLLSRVIVAAYFQAKFEYQKRFLKGIEGRD